MELTVRKKGQITIPVDLRKKYQIDEGTRLEVVETKEGILFKRQISIWDIVGSGSKYATPEEMKKLLDELRAEDE